jgi:hypothetical protein
LENITVERMEKYRKEPFQSIAFYFFSLNIAKKSSKKKITDLESMKLTMWKDPQNSQRKLCCIEVSRIALRRQGDGL